MDRKKWLNIWWFALLLLFKYRYESFCKLRKKRKESFWAGAVLSLAAALFCDELGGARRKERSLFPRMFQQCPVDHQCLPSVQLLSHVWLFATPCTACSTPGFPVLHQLPDLAETQVHQVSDAIQPSHCLSFHSPPAFSLSQHQGLFQWVSSLYQVAKVLEFQLQHQFFQWIFRTDFL